MTFSLFCCSALFDSFIVSSLIVISSVVRNYNYDYNNDCL